MGTTSVAVAVAVAVGGCSKRVDCWCTPTSRKPAGTAARCAAATKSPVGSPGCTTTDPGAAVARYWLSTTLSRRRLTGRTVRKTGALSNTVVEYAVPPAGADAQAARESPASGPAALLGEPKTIGGESRLEARKAAPCTPLAVVTTMARADNA